MTGVTVDRQPMAYKHVDVPRDVAEWLMKAYTHDVVRVHEQLRGNWFTVKAPIVCLAIEVD